MISNLPKDFTFPENMALFLDFDGTLASFKYNPDDVHLTNREIKILQGMNKRLQGALALISGRDIRDLSKRVPQEIWRLGNHGLFQAAPNADAPSKLDDFPEDLSSYLLRDLADIPGTRLESKGPVMAIHYRANPNAGDSIVKTIEPLLANHSDYYLQSGHYVVEVKPRKANKGIAITKHMKISPFFGRIPFMFGDDTTDEDGFLACQELGGIGIKIGEGHTIANFRVKSIAELYTHLERLT